MKTLSEKIKTLINTGSFSDFDKSVLSEALECARSKEYAVDRQAENEKNLQGAREQAFAQCSSIVEMVAAFECDYDRLEELVDEKKELQEEITNAETDEEVNEANANMLEWVNENQAELTELQEAAGECESQEEAIERIQNDPLDISVRSDWHSPGSEDNEPTEFTILLCTGGPAVRIVGELDDYRQPSRAWIEYQDWFTAWTHLIDAPIESDTLLTYCQQFYFGE